MPNFRQTLIFAASLALTGCSTTGALIGAGSLAGIGATQERGLGGGIGDYSLKIAINEAWFHESLAMYQRADFMVSEGRVLLFGRLPDEITGLQAELLAQKAGAKEVINRFTYGPDLGFGQEMTDQRIGTQLLVDITLDRDVAAVNYDIGVVNGTVYLLGIAQDEGEIRRVTYLAKQIEGVVGVESFVRAPNPVIVTSAPSGGTL